MKRFAYALILIMFLPCNALATQGHADPEGLYSHLIAHIFFIVSMVLLVYQIRKSKQKEDGWRYIGLAAILFILWNIDTFTVHIIRETLPNEIFSTPDGVWSKTVILKTFNSKVFYFGKIFDHILLVSSVLAFLKGVNAFQKTLEVEKNA